MKVGCNLEVETVCYLGVAPSSSWGVMVGL